MDIKLNADVQCTDGPAGHVAGVILNPIDDELTHIVVKHRGEAREIAANHIKSAADKVVLDCSLHDLHQQPNFTVTEYIHVPVEHSEFWPDGYYAPYVTTETYVINHQHIPAGEFEFTRGTAVFAKEDYIGRIDVLVVNPENYHITHIVLREGHLLGQKDVVIGVEHIKTITDEGVYLKLTHEQVKALPAIPLKRRFGLQPQH